MTKHRWLFLLLSYLLVSPRTARAEDDDHRAMTLQQCIDAALKHNPILSVEREKLREAEADYVVARSGLLPQVSASAYYNRLDPGRLVFGGFAAVPAPELFAGETFVNLKIQQLLFDGRVWPARRAALRGIDVRRLGVSSSRSQTVFAVTLAYTRLVSAGELVRVAKEALKRQLAFKELAEVFYKAGKTSRLDVLKAESQRTDAERTVISATENESLAQSQLRQALGGAFQQRVRSVDGLHGDLEAPPSEESLLAEAAKSNPQLKILSAQEGQAEALVQSSRGEHLPSLFVQGSYGLRHRDVGGAADEYAVGVFVDVPIFSGLATVGRVRKMQARQQQAQAVRRSFEDQIRVDVREALTSWRVSMADARFTASSVAVNREALLAATSLYEAGKVTALEVLSSQAELLRAEASHVQARGDYAIARARVQLVTGRLQSSSEMKHE